MSRLRTRKEWEAFLEELKVGLLKMGIDYRETSMIRTPGALCSVKGKKVVIVNRRLEASEKAALVKREVVGSDTEQFFLKPEVRDFLGK